jgi:hypothetical protein
MLDVCAVLSFQSATEARCLYELVRHVRRCDIPACILPPFQRVIEDEDEGWQADCPAPSPWRQCFYASDCLIFSSLTSSKSARDTEEAFNASANSQARPIRSEECSVSITIARACNCPATSSASCHGSPPRKGTFARPSLNKMRKAEGAR